MPRAANRLNGSLTSEAGKTGMRSVAPTHRRRMLHRRNHCRRDTCPRVNGKNSPVRNSRKCSLPSLGSASNIHHRRSRSPCGSYPDACTGSGRNRRPPVGTGTRVAPHNPNRSRTRRTSNSSRNLPRSGSDHCSRWRSPNPDRSDLDQCSPTTWARSAVARSDKSTRSRDERAARERRSFRRRARSRTRLRLCRRRPRG